MRKACIIIIGLVMLIYCVSVVYADLTATEGFAIDMSSAGAGTDFTVAFDPTEITGGTTWDDGGDASVEWTIDLSGTDPVVTFGSATVSVTGTILSSVGFDGVGAVDLDYGSADITDHTFTTNDCTFIVDGGITVSTGDTITLGVVAWNSGDNIDGEVIANDTIDNDSIDWADMADLDTDGAVVWGNLAEGELADSTVVSADIKDDTIDSADYAAGSIDDEHIADDTIQEPALNVTNAGEEGIDNYVLSYNHAGTNFTWVEMAGGANYVTNDADDTMAGDLTLDDDDDGTALTVRADAAGTGATVGLLITTDDDDSANYDPFEIRDDSGTGNDLLFFIDHTGAITTGEWQGTAIADAYVPDDITIDTAGVGTHVTVTDNEDQNEENEVPFVEDASGPGNVGLESDSGFTYNPSSGILTAAGFAGALTGNVTGTASGNATTSTKLDDFGTPDDNTDLNATTTYHGLLPKLPNDATKVIDGSGSWVDIEDLADEIAAGIAEGELADSIIVTGDIKDGEVAAGDLNATLDLSSKTITLPARPANQEHHLATTIWNPNALYDDDTQVCLWVKTSAAITITNIEVTCDADPDTELEFDLKWADAFIGLANAAVIDELDTTSGAASISEGFDDATVASGKCIYIEFQADPDSGITQIGIDVTFDYD